MPNCRTSGSRSLRIATRGPGLQFLAQASRFRESADSADVSRVTASSSARESNHRAARGTHRKHRERRSPASPAACNRKACAIGRSAASRVALVDIWPSHWSRTANTRKLEATLPQKEPSVRFLSFALRNPTSRALCVLFLRSRRTSFSSTRMTSLRRTRGTRRSLTD